jgi:hypothetical protein
VCVSNISALESGHGSLTALTIHNKKHYMAAASVLMTQNGIANGRNTRSRADGNPS